MPREPEGLEWHGGALREGGPAGDIAAMWSPQRLVTIVVGQRTDDELHALLDVALARCRAGEPQPPPAVIEPGVDRLW